jgi:UDP-galactopyranose mutase
MSEWIAERVSVVPWQQALSAVVHRRRAGVGATFAFRRGTGEIYRRLARVIGFGAAVQQVQASAQPGGGEVEQPYDQLVWTGPLDVLVRSIAGAPPQVVQAADALVHGSVTIVGIGCRPPPPTTGRGSHLQVPLPRDQLRQVLAAQRARGRTDRFSSWMTEIASSAVRPLDDGRLVDRVVESLHAAGLMPPDAPVVSRHVHHIPYAYPVPTLGRDTALAVIQPWLMAHAGGSALGATARQHGPRGEDGVDVARLLVTSATGGLVRRLFGADRWRSTAGTVGDRCPVSVVMPVFNRKPSSTTCSQWPKRCWPWCWQ